MEFSAKIYVCDTPKYVTLGQKNVEYRVNTQYADNSSNVV